MSRVFQDTVVALQALSDMASQMFTSDVSMNVTVEYGSESPKNVTINSENMDVLQFIDVSNLFSYIVITRYPLIIRCIKFKLDKYRTDRSMRKMVTFDASLNFIISGTGRKSNPSYFCIWQRNWIS